MADLILTNGDSAAELLAEAGLTGTILPWRDVLHEGPIVAGSLETVSAARAAYLAGRYAIDLADVATTFAERDQLMRDHARYDNVALWFEHDLYDQLQLIQILAFFHGEGRREGVTLVQADDFLGRQTPETILRFARDARAITDEDLATGADLWRALAAPTPEAVATALGRTDDRLPFVKPALMRFFEELPAPVTGLSRTEQAALEGIDHGESNPLRLFHSALAEEEAAFMGDASFFHLLDDLAGAEVPLISGMPPPGYEPPDLRTVELRLTPTGEAVLAGDEDHVELSGLDRWWAGTRLLGREVWRFDRQVGTLVAPESG